MGVKLIGESEALQHVSARTLRRWRKDRGLHAEQHRVDGRVVTLYDGEQFYALLDSVVPGRRLPRG